MRLFVRALAGETVPPNAAVVVLQQALAEKDRLLLAPFPLKGIPSPSSFCVMGFFEEEQQLVFGSRSNPGKAAPVSKATLEEQKDRISPLEHGLYRATSNMDESLEPLEPQLELDPESLPSTGGPWRRSWSLYAPLATFVLLSLLGGTVGVFLFPRRLLSGNVESLESLTALETKCADVKCTEHFLGHNWMATCNGNADSLECINTCCTEEVHCAALGDFCGDQGVSANTVAILPGGTEAISGGDDGQVSGQDAYGRLAYEGHEQLSWQRRKVEDVEDEEEVQEVQEVREMEEEKEMREGDAGDAGDAEDGEVAAEVCTTSQKDGAKLSALQRSRQTSTSWWAMSLAAFAFGSLAWVAVETIADERKTYDGFIKALIPKAHVGKVNALMPAPAGDVFWSGGDDGWIREWEAGSGKALRSHYAAYAGPTLSLAMIPGGNAFYSGHAGGVFLLWLVAETEWALCHVDPEGGKVKSLSDEEILLECGVTEELALESTLFVTSGLDGGGKKRKKKTYTKPKLLGEGEWG
eukprot:Skav231115  [mRNA]  locus=scaffold7:4545:20985:- [translate_table: standard]